MAVHKAWANVTPLRVITRVLATAHDDHLPAIAHKYAGLVQGIGPVWSLTASDSRDADQAETAVLVHQFKKQLSNLVHDRAATRNFAAILFIKAVVEAAELKSIQTELNLWVKGLLNILRVSFDKPLQIRPGESGAKFVSEVQMRESPKSLRPHPDTHLSSERHIQ